MENNRMATREIFAATADDDDDHDESL